MIGVFCLGIFAGVISGMGIGGGTLLIPGLIFLGGVTQHQAQGINLLYFMPTGCMALWTHLKNGNVEKEVVKPIAFYGLLGALVGSFCAVSLDGMVLRKIFGGFLCFMGILEVLKGKKVWKKRRNEGT